MVPQTGYAISILFNPSSTTSVSDTFSFFIIPAYLLLAIRFSYLYSLDSFVSFTLPSYFFASFFIPFPLCHLNLLLQIISILMSLWSWSKIKTSPPSVFYFALSPSAFLIEIFQNHFSQLSFTSQITLLFLPHWTFHLKNLWHFQ